MPSASTVAFRWEDFRYFVVSPKERQSLDPQIFQRKLQQLTRELIESAPLQAWFARFGPVSPDKLITPGVFQRDSYEYWITLGPKNQRKHCHFTVRLAEDGIALEAFSPYKSFTDAFLDRIASHPSAFLSCLRPLADIGYRIRLREAYYANPESRYKGQRISGKHDFLVLHPSVLTPDNVNPFVIEPLRSRLKEKGYRPEIFLIRQFPLSEMVRRNQLVEHLAEAAVRMFPYLEFASGF